MVLSIWKTPVLRPVRRSIASWPIAHEPPRVYPDRIVRGDRRNCPSRRDSSAESQSGKVLRAPHRVREQSSAARYRVANLLGRERRFLFLVQLRFHQWRQTILVWLAGRWGGGRARI